MSDLSMPWGTTKPFDFVVTLGPGGAAVDLTGKSMKLMVKHRHEDPDNKALISLTNGGGITYTTPASGLARATFTPSMTSALDPGRTYELVYSLRLIDGSNAYDLLAGAFTVGRVVVRAVS